MSNILSFIKSPIVIFCPPSERLSIMKARGNLPVVIQQQYWSIWDVPHAKNFRDIYSEKDGFVLMDPDKHFYSSELWGIYNSKVWFVEHAININWFNSTYFAWIDIGSQRTALNYQSWPNTERIIETFNGYEDRIIVGFVDPPLPSAILIAKNLSSPPNFKVGAKDTVEGTFFFGNAASLRWLCREYYSLRDLWKLRKQYVGMDQVLFKTLVLRYGRERFIGLSSFETVCGDKWFYFWHHFASEKERMNNCQLLVKELLF